MKMLRNFVKKKSERKVYFPNYLLINQKPRILNYFACALFLTADLETLVVHISKMTPTIYISNGSYFLKSSIINVVCLVRLFLLATNTNC